MIRFRPSILISLVIATSLLSLMSATPSDAGDFAEFRPLGFSADGKLFGFEEFGIQDGSGFPYATRYVIDTESDSYAAAPVRVRIDDEAATLAAARAKAAALSPPAMASLADDPGIFAAFAPPSEIGSGGLKLDYNSFSIEPYPFGPNRVELTEKPLPASPACKALGAKSVGFTLRMTRSNGAPASILMQDDKSVPASRNCPGSYRIGGALTHANPDGTTTHVILVLIRSQGFEGADGRWIAVTTRVN